VGLLADFLYYVGVAVVLDGDFLGWVCCGGLVVGVVGVVVVVGVHFACCWV